MIYKCAMCQKEFEAGWSDEEAAAEMRSHFGNVRLSECEVVCDDCYKKIDPAYHPHLVEETLRENRLV